MPIIKLFLRGRMFSNAFSEQKKCMHSVYGIARNMLQCDSNVPSQYLVELAPIPKELFRLRKNLFSVLFMSAYHALGIPAKRRIIYGQILHLFRIWVTSADNLLDDENKIALPLRMPATGGVMSQVLSIMTADRILQKILSTAMDANELTEDQAEKISYATLQVLLPSAAQEASEEGGITERPSPQDIRNVVHLYKTSVLFQLPFAALQAAGEPCDVNHLAEIRSALMQFGGGCQLLDDIRDMATDLIEKRHNYMLSWLACNEPGNYGELARDAQAGRLAIGDRLYRKYPKLTQMVLAEASAEIQQSLLRLHGANLGLSTTMAEIAPRLMRHMLDIGDCNAFA